LKLIIKRG